MRLEWALTKEWRERLRQHRCSSQCEADRQKRRARAASQAARAAEQAEREERNTDRQARTEAGEVVGAAGRAQDDQEAELDESPGQICPETSPEVPERPSACVLLIR